MSAAPASPSTKAAVTPEPPRTVRMTLDSIRGGKIDGPLRILVHGVDGVGKTTFAASAPKPVFLGAEDGTQQMDVPRFPPVESWTDILDAIRSLAADKRDYETLVVDTVDWAEPYAWRHICKKAEVASIEDVGGGYGKGYDAAVDEWRTFTVELERLQKAQKMNVILLGHSFIKGFKNPEGDDYDRYILKMKDKSAALLREWCNGVYFANYETFAVKDKQKRVRGVSSGARILYTQRTAVYDAKDRYGLPESIPLDWDEFWNGVQTGRVSDPVELVAEIERKAKEAGGEVEKKALESLGRNAGDVGKLVKLNTWLNAKLIQKGT